MNDSRGKSAFAGQLAGSNLRMSKTMTLVESMSRGTDWTDLPELDPNWESVRNGLELCFGTSFAILDVERDELLFAGAIVRRHDQRLPLELCGAVIERSQPEFLAEHEPVVLLAVPITCFAERYIAFAPFVVHQSDRAAIAKSMLASVTAPKKPRRGPPISRCGIPSGCCDWPNFKSTSGLPRNACCGCNAKMPICRRT